MCLSPRIFMSQFVSVNEKPNGISEPITGLIFQAFWAWKKNKPTHANENLQSDFCREMVEKIACGALADAVLNICIQGRISISLSTAVSKHNQFLQKSTRSYMGSCKPYLIPHYSDTKLFGRLMIIPFSCPGFPMCSFLHLWLFL